MDKNYINNYHLLGLYLFKKQFNKETSAYNSELYKFDELTFGAVK